MNVHRTKTFRSGNSEAVRLPKGIGFGEGVEVEVTREGDSLRIRRMPRYSGRDLVEALGTMSKPDRVQERDPIGFPDRPGL